MNNLSKWKIIGCLAAIFLVGAATGAVTAVGVAKKVMDERLRLENLEENVMELSRSRLELTPEQVIRIRPLVDQACREYKALQRQTLERVAQIIHDSNQRIAKELTPNQVQKLQEWERKRRERELGTESPPK